MEFSKQLSTNKIKIDQILIVIIIMIGAIMRMWNFSSIPFMHDELSGLSRLQFDNFSDLIHHGVMIGDTHPAGVQVFLYYWTYLFGTSEVMVKLPFIISGVISIWVSYKIGKLWFDSTTGLLTAVMIASTQFFVMYSQIARPYVSGLILTLLMVYFWSLYFFKKRNNLYLLFFVFFAAMSTYNHHFSLLFAAIVGVTGLVFIRNRKELVNYAISGVAIFILYIPHLHIFFSQLNHGGVGGEEGWLGKPDTTFFLDFLDYLMQFSIWSWVILLIVILLLFFAPGKFAPYEKKWIKRSLLIIWFILPIIIGYVYSILRNPVIQYSMLIFSTPYIYILVFSVHKKLVLWQKALTVFLLMLINILVLVYGRDHYKIFYHQPYDVLFTTALLENNPDNITILDDCIPYYNTYYFNKYGGSPNYFTKRDTDIGISEFKEIVAGIQEEIVVTHDLTGEELQIVRSYFPYQLDCKRGFTYEIYTFSRKNPEMEIISISKLAMTNFNEEIGNWKDVSDIIVCDSISKKCSCAMYGEEWGPSISFELSKIAPDGFGIVDVNMEMVMKDTIVKTLLIASIYKGDKKLFWRAVDAQDYKPQLGSWFTIYLSLDIQAALKGMDDMDSVVLKINVWNINNANSEISEINIDLLSGNPLRYSLYKPILKY